MSKDWASFSKATGDGAKIRVSRLIALFQINWWSSKYPRANAFGFFISSESKMLDLGIPDRASKKVFSSSILKPNSKEYTTISQKLMNASGARYIIFWLANVLRALAEQDPANEFYQLLGPVLSQGFRCPVGYTFLSVETLT